MPKMAPSSINAREIEMAAIVKKRDQFAAMAMQGLLAAPDLKNAAPEAVAVYSIQYADALIAALENSGGCSNESPAK